MAAWVAANAVGNAHKTSSPIVWTTRPPHPSADSRMILRHKPTHSSARALPSFSYRRVLPVMSANRTARFTGFFSIGRVSHSGGRAEYKPKGQENTLWL